MGSPTDYVLQNIQRDGSLHLSDRIPERSLINVSLPSYLSDRIPERSLINVSLPSYLSDHIPERSLINVSLPSYLSDRIPERSLINVSLRSRSKQPPRSRTERYDNSFLPFCVNKWNNLKDSIKSLPSLTQFKKELRSFVHPKGTIYYGGSDNLGIKLLTKIRVIFPI